MTKRLRKVARREVQQSLVSLVRQKVRVARTPELSICPIHLARCHIVSDPKGFSANS